MVKTSIVLLSLFTTIQNKNIYIGKFTIVSPLLLLVTF